ncbi:hypothetical protein SLA2020_183260 [Shorea laevis]
MSSLVNHFLPTVVMVMMTTKARIMTLRLVHAADVVGFCFCEGKDFMELREKTGGVAQDVAELRKEGEPGVYRPNHSVVVAE